MSKNQILVIFYFLLNAYFLAKPVSVLELFLQNSVFPSNRVFEKEMSV